MLTAHRNFTLAIVTATIGVLAHMAGPASASFMVIAHRGDSVNAPENTIASINSAVGKATHTEMDGHTTADGHLVLMHDDTVDRTTDGTGLVASMTLAQVQTLDAGSWFSPVFAGEPVPTVTQAVTTALAGGLTPVIERKNGTPQQYLDALAGHENDVAVISFDLLFLTNLRALHPTIQLGYLGGGAMSATVVNNAVAGGVDFLSWHFAGITQARVDVAHQAGLGVAAWTVDDPVTMQSLINMGVDGITTNNPALLQSLVPEPGTLAIMTIAGSLCARRRRPGGAKAC